MDKRLFTADAPGTLVEQTLQGKQEWAFIPDPLPPKWQLNSRLWALVAEAKEKIGILEGIGRNLPNPDILLSPLAKTEALKSSSIEGTYATPLDYLKYELNPREAKSEKDKINDWRQVFNYRDSLYFGIEESERYGQATLTLIRNMHSLLLRGVRGRDRHPGAWRPDLVMIGFPPRFIPPPRAQLEPCLQSLIEFINSDAPFDYLVKSFLVHYQFETVHPFSDGNGRMGRLLLAMNIYQWSAMTKPWLFMSSFFEKNRDEYIDRLFQVSAKGQWSEWINFCLRGTIATAEETIRKIEDLTKLQTDLQERVRSTGGNVRLTSIVNQLFVSPFIEVSQAAELTGVSRPTARADLQRLVDCDVIKVLSGERPVIYFSPSIFNASYSD